MTDTTPATGVAAPTVHGDLAALEVAAKKTPYHSFLQTAGWATFQAALGRQVHIVSTDNAASLAVQVPVGHNRSYWYLPRAPLVATGASVSDELEGLVGQIKQLVDSTVVFVKVEPAVNVNLGHSSYSVQPSRTQVVQLTADEPALLQRCHPKTRYNIRLAAKKGVTVSITSQPQPADIDTFMNIAADVEGRTRFGFHDKTYYLKMCATLKRHQMIAVATASVKDTVVASHILVTHGGTTTYLHGASSNKHRSLMAPHLLQWESMRWARQLGSQQYDFWGIAPHGATNHSWSGITRFKSSYGGSAIEYASAQDIPIKSVEYVGYRIYKALRKKN